MQSERPKAGLEFGGVELATSQTGNSSLEVHDSWRRCDGLGNLKWTHKGMRLGASSESRMENGGFEVFHNSSNTELVNRSRRNRRRIHLHNDDDDEQPRTRVSWKLLTLVGLDDFGGLAVTVCLDDLQQHNPSQSIKHMQMQYSPRWFGRQRNRLVAESPPRRRRATINLRKQWRERNKRWCRRGWRWSGERKMTIRTNNDHNHTNLFSHTWASKETTPLLLNDFLQTKTSTTKQTQKQQ